MCSLTSTYKYNFIHYTHIMIKHLYPLVFCTCVYVVMLFSAYWHLEFLSPSESHLLIIRMLYTSVVITYQILSLCYAQVWLLQSKICLFTDKWSRYILLGSWSHSVSWRHGIIPSTCVRVPSSSMHLCWISNMSLGLWNCTIDWIIN